MFTCDPCTIVGAGCVVLAVEDLAIQGLLEIKDTHRP